MDGVGGYSGWRWVFILIGLVTFVSGVLSFWLCVDFPDTAKFLSDSERRAIIRRLQNDQQFSAAGEGFKRHNVYKAFLQWQTWCGMGAYMFVQPTPGCLYTAPSYLLTCLPLLLLRHVPTAAAMRRYCFLGLSNTLERKLKFRVL